MDEDLLNQAESETKRDKRLVRQAESEMQVSRRNPCAHLGAGACAVLTLRSSCQQGGQVIPGIRLPLKAIVAHQGAQCGRPGRAGEH